MFLTGAAGVALCGCDSRLPMGAPVRVSATYGSLGDTPGRFAYPRAICADAATDSIWVIDKLARVQQLDAADGEVLAIWRMPEYELGKPTGLSIGPGLERDGETLLFVPDTHYNRVMIFRPPAPVRGKRDMERPELVGTFGAYGDGPGQFIFPTDIGILPTADGKRVERLYITEYGGNDRVSVYDASLHFLFSFGRYGAGASAEDVQFDRPQSVEVDLTEAGRRDGGGRGRLVVTDSRNSRVGVFTLEGKLLRWFGSPERATDEAGAFRIPYGLELLGDGTALVSEFGNNRVQRLDLETGESLGTWGKPGRGEGELVTPWGVAVIGDRTFILDSGNYRVLVTKTASRRGG